ncbi:hypothetical protein JG688_00003029 [Phytophthora aleatoria]|uniref:Uncharacterized protein n=1 Tax=Phytophthora aleatoria TaxID=2496075 RepID=A0A8J5JBP7_9STRA|nr:hypothetical protein JG688_00003029 [Phytophthora aleatoria]
MEPGKVNRLAKYGRRTINIRDVFLTAPESTAFFRDYAFNENKSLVQEVSAGHRKVWECTSDVCQWQVTLSKKSKAKRANTKKIPSVPPMHGLYPTQASCILLAVIPSASVHWNS